MSSCTLAKQLGINTELLISRMKRYNWNAKDVVDLMLDKEKYYKGIRLPIYDKEIVELCNVTTFCVRRYTTNRSIEDCINYYLTKAGYI